MAAFGMGTNGGGPDGKMDSGALLGRQIKIACKAWFTSGGTVSPLSFKFEGDDGMVQTVNHVTVKYREEKHYSGIPSVEYGCSAVMGGLLREFKLLFYPEEGRWIMVLAK